MLKAIVQTLRPRRVFYAKNIHMGLSFDGLEKIAREKLGGELEFGDIIVVDNKKHDKRKVMQWTKKGFMIYYARYHKQFRFNSLADNDGQLKRIEQTVVL